MNYIYDIYLNLNEVLYDFFDWNKKDNLIHIKKIPIFMLDSDTLNMITFNNIKISNVFIKKINNKTVLWNNTNNITCALFCDSNNIIAIEFDNEGTSLKKSYLYIDEEAEVLDDIDDYSITNITFELLDKTPILLTTRNELNMNNFINKELSKIDKKKLDYICYECLGKKKGNINNLKSLEHSSSNYKNLYDILKLTSKETN